MPIRHGGMLASRVSIWPRDHFCRSTIAPRRSRPTTWNEFLPISMPIVAMVAIDLLDMAVLRLTLAPSQHHSPVGQEHGRTIPLPDLRSSSDHAIGDAYVCVRYVKSMLFDLVQALAGVDTRNQLSVPGQLYCRKLAPSGV